MGNDQTNKVPVTKPATPIRNKDLEMGSALRSVYQKTVEEAVPDEMLDLLGKLD